VYQRAIFKPVLFKRTLIKQTLIGVVAAGVTFPVFWSPPAASANPVVNFLLSYAAGKALDMFVDPILKPATRNQVVQKATILRGQTSGYDAKLYALEQRLKQCVTKGELRAAMQDTLRQIDARMAAHAQRLYRLEAQQAADQQKLRTLERRQKAFESETRQQFDDVRATTGYLGRRIDRTDSRLTEFEKRYPRYKPHQQALVMGQRGYEAYLAKDYNESVKWLRHAEASGNASYGVCYMLALAYRAQGNMAAAGEAAARGVALERRQGQSKWYKTISQRIQGAPRRWLEKQRSDPDTGVFVPGHRG